jgi:hypothetical protein
MAFERISIARIDAGAPEVIEIRDARVGHVDGLLPIPLDVLSPDGFFAGRGPKDTDGGQEDE